MEEKERAARLGNLKKYLVEQQVNLQRLQQAIGQTQIRMVDLAARINELEEEKWKETPKESVKVPEPEAVT